MHKQLEPWRKIESSIVYKGFRSIIRKVFALPNGGTQDYDIVDGHAFCSIVAQTESGDFLLGAQFRPGPEKILVGFPAGHIDAGETPEAAAHRELLEETGFEAGTMVFLKKIHTAYAQGVHYCFVATNCKKVANPRLEDDEYIEQLRMSLEELRVLLRNTTDDSFYNIEAAYLALDYLKLL